jgi:hypothetical protein
MSGYRDNADSFGEPPQRVGWKKWLLITGFAAVYAIPLFFWLLRKIDFPDSFGVRITAHGKAGVFDTWWYSYLLVERHRPLDLVTFAYMWIPVVAFAGWLAYRQLRGANFSLYSNPVE